MTNEEIRLECLQMVADIIKRTGEYVEPWERANQFYNYVMTGDPTVNKAPAVRKKPGPKPKRK